MLPPAPTTPLAPLLHHATTPAQRCAEEERLLAERFRNEALQIEVHSCVSLASIRSVL